MPSSPNAPPLRSVQLQLKLTPEEKRRFFAAAREQGMPLTVWLRQQALKAARASEKAVA
jgi:hypothetical protein